jgi:hypothetical protein
MGDLSAFFGIALGVVISVVLPPLSAYVKKMFRPTAASIDLQKYLVLGIFSLVVALLVLAGYRLTNPSTTINFYLAIVIGYTWESTVEKIVSS